ncbi:MAG: hypothetical protein IAE97_06810 [Chthoniobacterales bacterium]|nr:hypothetical protein [Chthoniobacterales bacterium]
MARTPSPKVHNSPAITITRTAYAASELVYIAYANKPLRYQHGKSKIAYIGTTKKGAGRVANSAVWKAEELFARKGVHTLEFYIIAAPRKGKVATYRKLERALLLRFRERFGSIPHANKQGKNLRWRDEYEFVTPRRIDKIIDDFSA